MKYAVISKYFDSGKVVAEIRPAQPGEKESSNELSSHDEYVDLFDSKKAAEVFAAGCKKA